MIETTATESFPAIQQPSRRQARWGLFGLGLLVLAGGCWGDDTPAQPASTTTTTSYIGQTREYWIVAEDVLWDYAPSYPINLITGEPFDDAANVFVQTGPGSDRPPLLEGAVPRVHVALPARKPPARAWEPRPLGPVVRAAVATHRDPFQEQRAVPGQPAPARRVLRQGQRRRALRRRHQRQRQGRRRRSPGGTRVYTWAVPERAGPGPNDGSSVFWMYHSHTDEVMDTYTGLMGPLVITAAGKAQPDGSPADIDRELYTMFLVFDENQSHYLDQTSSSRAIRAASTPRTRIHREQPDALDQRLRLRQPARA